MPSLSLYTKTIWLLENFLAINKKRAHCALFFIIDVAYLTACPGACLRLVTLTADFIQHHAGGHTDVQAL